MMAFLFYNNPTFFNRRLDLYRKILFFYLFIIKTQNYGKNIRRTRININTIKNSV